MKDPDYHLTAMILNYLLALVLIPLVWIERRLQP
jgi:hypothetical protein